jgi:sugar/nucleoside kinase (ribokinase family)
MAGFLHAHVRGADVRGCLEAGSAQAAVALSTRHLHPALDSLIET